MVSEPLATELREQGRGVVGALLVIGVSALHTVETWWAGWQLASLHLLAYAFVGLAVVLAITRTVGFRAEGESAGSGATDGETAGDGATDGEAADGGATEGGTADGRPTDGEMPEGDRTSGADAADGRRGGWREVVADFLEILVQGFVAAYAYFLLFGVIELAEEPIVVARLGLMEVVPLGFGAALANRILTGERGRESPSSFASNLAITGLGAVFVAAPIAPTEEVLILASNAGWARLAVVVVATLVVTELTLYELEFMGQQRRIRGVEGAARWTEAAVVYAVGCAVAFGLLAMFGRVAGQGVAVWVQAVVVLGFPAAIGGSAARVVLG